jgi:hypothetical protein
MSSLQDTTDTVVISTKDDELEQKQEQDIDTASFILQKLQNFQQFLIDNVPNEGLRQQVEAIKSMPLPLIYAWITDELQTQADLGQYVDKLFVKYDIEPSSVDTAVIEKVKRYFECFISCI